MLYCESCEFTKATRKAIKREREGKTADVFGEEIHTDLWGLLELQTLGGRHYYITFTDDYSCFTVTRLLKAKSEALQAYKDFVAWVQTQHGAKIKHLHSDRGSEYTSRSSASFFKSKARSVGSLPTIPHSTTGWPNHSIDNSSSAYAPFDTTADFPSIFGARLSITQPGSRTVLQHGP